MDIVKSILRWAVVAALGGAVCVLVGVAGAKLHWTFDLAAQFLLPAIVVAAASAFVAFMFKWFRIAGAGALVAAIAFGVAWPWQSPPAPVRADAPRFTMLLFNVWFNNGRLAELRQMIEQQNADIVVLIEATHRVSDAMQGLSAKYPYKLDCVGSGPCDILIFSRSRLVPREIIATAGAVHSPLVSVETDLMGCRLTLFATHMTRPFPKTPFWGQRAQADEIAGNVASAFGSKLVVGDFNAAPWGYVIQTIAQRNGLSVLTGGSGTWPSFLPWPLRIPIDNVMAGEGLTFVSRDVLPSMGSDHLPVRAEIAVTDPMKCRPNSSF